MPKEKARGLWGNEVKAVAVGTAASTIGLIFAGESGYALLVGASVGFPVTTLLLVRRLWLKTQNLHTEIHRPPELFLDYREGKPPPSSGPTLEGAGVPSPNLPTPSKLKATVAAKRPEEKQVLKK